METAKDWKDKGNALVKEKKYKEALDCYSKAIEIDPIREDAIMYRALVKKDLKDFSGAKKDLERAISFNPSSSEAHNNYADLLIEIGDLDTALLHANQSILLDDSEYVHFLTRGEIYMAMLKYNEAVIDFNNAINLNDKYKESYEKRAKCYRKLAEQEQDEQQKADYLNKAKADEDKAKELP